MDFSTSLHGKKKPSGLSYAPVPPPFREALLKTGLLFHVYYENIASPPLVEADAPGRLRTFPFFCLVQLLEGDAFFYDGERHSTRYFSAGSGLLVAPGLPQRYGGRTRPFVEDSLCFSGPLAELLARQGLLRTGIFPLGGERRLLPVIRALQQGTLPALLEASAMLAQLLLRLPAPQGTPETAREPRPGRLDALLAGVRETPERQWSVEELADYLNISTNALRREFLAQLGMTPKHYLDQLWVRRATELLCLTQLPVLEVARRLKCSDPYYFFRKFRKLTGTSPGQYRRQFPGWTGAGAPSDPPTT